MKKNIYYLILIIFLALPLEGYAGAYDEFTHNSGNLVQKHQSELSHVSSPATPKAFDDPIEDFNRVIFQFNDIVDKLILKPIAQIYDYVLPTEGKKVVQNVISNLSMPVTTINQVAQGKSDEAITSFWRFVINSTLGIGGVLDVATPAGLNKAAPEDTGQTLAHYDVAPGPYIVLPLLGPSDARDVVGRVVDFFLDPFNFVVHEKTLIARTAITVVHNRSASIEITDHIDESSFDPYASFRSLFLQHRNNLIKQ